jgi:hypothetical protein
MHFHQFGTAPAAMILLCSCSSTTVLTAAGPNKTADSGQFAIFANLYDDALKQQNTTYANALIDQGFSLIYNNCLDFFRSEGKLQTTLNVIRDTTALVGSIAAGAIAALHTSQDAAAVVSLTTAGISGGITIANTNFLFGSDNIDAVRDLTVKALATHNDAVAQAIRGDPASVTVPWALTQISDHQVLCEPAHILAMTRSAIQNGTVEAYNAGATSPSLGLTQQKIDDFRSSLAKAVGVNSITDDQAAALYWLIVGNAPSSVYPFLASKLKDLGGNSPFDVNNEVVPNWSSRQSVQRLFQITDVRIKGQLEQAIGAWKTGGTAAVVQLRAREFAPPSAPVSLVPTTPPAAAPPSLPSHIGVRIARQS